MANAIITKHCAANRYANKLTVCTLTIAVTVHSAVTLAYSLTHANDLLDCSRSVFGCCPDLLTPATGWNLHGCPGRLLNYVYECAFCVTLNC